MTRPQLESDRMLCHTCNKITRWWPGKGGRFLKCEECGHRLPCRGTCKHEDCAEARKGRIV